MMRNIHNKEGGGYIYRRFLKFIVEKIKRITYKYI